MVFADYGLLKSFASRHTLRVSLALQGCVCELTQGVGSTCSVMILCTVISLSFVSISSFASLGTHTSVLHQQDFGINCDGLFVSSSH